jgi:hypothetical protein
MKKLALFAALVYVVVIVQLCREPRLAGQALLLVAAALVPMLLVTSAFAYPRLAKLRRERERVAARLCYRCGYDLNGTSPLCPGCGRPFGENDL